ncbi:MAG: hypothetical protein ACK5EK_04370, partial [Flavobacteriia bacterium]
MTIKQKILFLIGFLIVVITVGLIRKSNRKIHLLNSKITIAVYTKNIIGVGSTGIYVRFKNDRNEIIEAKVPANQSVSHLKIGDTIQIKYSITNY